DDGPRDTRLRDTRLRDTRLRDTRLRDTRLRDTRLRDTRLRDTRLRDTRRRDTQPRVASAGNLFPPQIGQKPWWKTGQLTQLEILDLSYTQVTDAGWRTSWRWGSSKSYTS